MFLSGQGFAGRLGPLLPPLALPRAFRGYGCQEGAKRSAKAFGLQRIKDVVGLFSLGDQAG